MSPSLVPRPPTFYHLRIAHPVYVSEAGMCWQGKIKAAKPKISLEKEPFSPGTPPMPPLPPPPDLDLARCAWHAAGVDRGR
eukprot:3294698-Rhodomonas_salina.1